MVINMTITYQIPDKDVKKTLKMLERYYKVVATPAIIERLLKKNSELIDEVGSTDTWSRERFIDAVTSDVKVGYWPCNADPIKDVRHFYKQFKKRAVKKGYKVKF